MNELKYCIVDLETSSQEVNGRTASPFDDLNFIVAWSIKDTDKQITRYCMEEEDREELIDLLVQYDTIVAHNTKFECLYFWKYEKFQQWLIKGGKIYCTQLAEYYLTDYQTQWAALIDISVNKYKCPERIKWIDDLLFENPKSEYGCVSELPIDKVLEDVDNDVKDTFIVYNEQQKLIKNRGNTFRALLENQMECLLSTIEMEYNGVFIDEQVAQVDKKELEEELELLDKELNQLVSKYWHANT